MNCTEAFNMLNNERDFANEEVTLAEAIICEAMVCEACSDGDRQEIVSAPGGPVHVRCSICGWVYSI